MKIETGCKKGAQTNRHPIKIVKQQIAGDGLLLDYYFLFCYPQILDLFKRLIQIVDEVIDMLCTDAQTDGRWSDVLLGQFLGCHL